VVPFRLGRYVFHEQIAAGGMARVHLAKMCADGGFAPIVAIKRLHSSYAGEASFVEMFLDEAKLAGRIRHPNVVPVLDVVATGGELFLVMEYVHGDSLARLWKDHAKRGVAMDAEMVSAVVVGMLQGLHAAHEARGSNGQPLDIVHRDVSPHNVLVGADGLARLLDFGVAKASGRLSSTREGELKGKLAYMSPEQLRQEPITRQSDIYSAAIVLWEALTGMRLFAGENAGAIVERVLFAEVQPPSTHRSDLSAAIDQVVMRGLARDRGKRWASAQDMANALQEALPPARPQKIAEWVQDVCGVELEQRSRSIAELEALDGETVQPEAVKGATSEGAGDPRPPLLTVEDATRLTASSPSERSRTTKKRTAWMFAAGVTILGLGATARTYALRSPSVVPALPSAKPPQPVSAGPSATVSVSELGEPAPTASVAASGPSPAPSATAPTHAPMRKAPPPSAANKTCLVSYRTPEGIKKYRTVTGAECKE
jgi:eukaryotic-like serine/threonine-protein kinase